MWFHVPNVSEEDPAAAHALSRLSRSHTRRMHADSNNENDNDSDGDSDSDSDDLSARHAGTGCTAAG